MSVDTKMYMADRIAKLEEALSKLEAILLCFKADADRVALPHSS